MAVFELEIAGTLTHRSPVGDCHGPGKLLLAVGDNGSGLLSWFIRDAGVTHANSVELSSLRPPELIGSTLHLRYAQAHLEVESARARDLAEAISRVSPRTPLAGPSPQQSLGSSQATPTAGGSGPTWSVLDSGVVLTLAPGGVSQLMRLEGGTVVVEVESRGEYLKVAAPDGRTGWLHRRAVTQWMSASAVGRGCELEGQGAVREVDIEGTLTHRSPGQTHHGPGKLHLTIADDGSGELSWFIRDAQGTHADTVALSDLGPLHLTGNRLELRYRLAQLEIESVKAADLAQAITEVSPGASLTGGPRGRRSANRTLERLMPELMNHPVTVRLSPLSSGVGKQAAADEAGDGRRSLIEQQAYRMAGVLCQELGIQQGSQTHEEHLSISFTLGVMGWKVGRSVLDHAGMPTLAGALSAGQAESLWKETMAVMQAESFQAAGLSDLGWYLVDSIGFAIPQLLDADPSSKQPSARALMTSGWMSYQFGLALACAESGTDTL